MHTPAKQHLHLVDLFTEWSSLDAYIARASVSLAYDRTLIRGARLALEESRELLSRVRAEHNSHYWPTATIQPKSANDVASILSTDGWRRSVG